MTEIEKRRIHKFVEEMESFDPETEGGNAVEFEKIARCYPYISKDVDNTSAVVWMSDFAETGYCLYNAWHHGHKTEEKRLPIFERKLIAGSEKHEKKVKDELKVARKLPRATPSDLRNLKVDIVRIPEFKSRIKVDDLIYSSEIERAGRSSGQLVVTEIKTGKHTLMSNHYLQVWGYCISAPCALIRLTNGDYHAKGIFWSLEYTKYKNKYGPYQFTENNLKLLNEAMGYFKKLYYYGLKNDISSLSGLFESFPNKCKACAFFHSCVWRVE